MTSSAPPAPPRRSLPGRHRVVGAAFAALAAVALLLSWAAPASAVTSGARPAVAKPTIVLVHGAFADPTSWSQVAARLDRDGYRTVVPALDLASVAGDVAIVRATLDGIAGPKVVVAHSYGGFVTTNALTGRTDVTAMVLTAAYLPDAGESINSLGTGFIPPAFLAAPFPPGHLLIDQFGFATIDPAYFRGDFAQDLNPKRAAAMAAAQHPVSLNVLFTPSGPPAWTAIPSWYAISGADRIIDPALQRLMAARAGSHVVTFDSASHAGGFTHYAAPFTKLVEQAATTGAVRS
ncbi:MAG: alpha/beta hydrolase [Actinomycetota bacterium]|nr:alpha/beta hydrolase [Actinomycetota bacterium]